MTGWGWLPRVDWVRRDWVGAAGRLRAGDVVWAAVWGGASLAGMVSSGPWVAGLLLGLVTVVALGVRRVAPRVAGCALLVVLVGQALLSGSGLSVATLIVAPALAYVSRRHLPRVWRLWVPVVLGSGIAGFLLFSPVFHGTALLDRLPMAGWGLGTVAVAGLVGELRRRSALERAAQVERLELQLRLQREEFEGRSLEQRAFIAREVHDIVAHTLATIVAQADGGRYAAAGDPASAQEALATIARVGRTSLRQMRGLVAVLRDEDQERGLTPGVGLDELGELAAEVSASGVRVHLVEDGQRPAWVPQDVSLTIYRIVQEGLSNVRKHSSAEDARVVLAWETDRVRVSVEDAGPRRPAPASGVGLGLRGAGERVAVAGGQFQAGPWGSGWRLLAEFPVESGWWA